jgi:hypothetical protein
MPFRCFDPYQTFSGATDMKRFAPAVSGRSIWSDEGDDSDVQALWRLGKKVYDCLEVVDESDFREMIAVQMSNIEEFRDILLQRALRSGAKFGDDIVTAPDEIRERIAELDLSEVVDTCHQLVSYKPLDDSLWPIFSGMYLMGALLEIDHALIQNDLKFGGAIRSALAAAEMLDRARSLMPHENSLRLARKQLATNAAAAKLNNDPRQADKRFVRECWDEWQREPERYESQAAFARDMMAKCAHLTSVAVVERWCRAWKQAD